MRASTVRREASSELEAAMSNGLAGSRVHSVGSDLATIVETRTTRLGRGEVGEG